MWSLACEQALKDRVASAGNDCEIVCISPCAALNKRLDGFAGFKRTCESCIMVCMLSLRRGWWGLLRL